MDSLSIIVSIWIKPKTLASSIWPDCGWGKVRYHGNRSLVGAFLNVFVSTSKCISLKIEMYLSVHLTRLRLSATGLAAMATKVWSLQAGSKTRPVLLTLPPLQLQGPSKPNNNNTGQDIWRFCFTPFTVFPIVYFLTTSWRTSVDMKGRIIEVWSGAVCWLLDQTCHPLCAPSSFFFNSCQITTTIVKIFPPSV